MNVKTRPISFFAVTGCLFLNLLVGCIPVTTSSYEGIGFREARFAEISEMREYRACVEDGLKLSERAKLSGQVGGYRASAILLSKCESDLGPNVSSIATEERMRNYALSIVNYAKSGDLKMARVNLTNFDKTFDGSDLFFPSGASFMDTMDLLTTKVQDLAVADVALMNVPENLRSEVQRARFWKNN